MLNAGGYSLGEYGWLLYVDLTPEYPVVSKIEQPSPGLSGAIRTAREQGCDYLLLDRHAGTLKGVPTYDW